MMQPFAPCAFTQFLATMRCPDSCPRFGTLLLAGSADLECSLTIEVQASHVPHESLDHAHAASIPDATRPADRFALSSSVPRQRPCAVSTSAVGLSRRLQRFTCVRLHGRRLTRSRRAFPFNVHHHPGRPPTG